MKDVGDDENDNEIDDSPRQVSNVVPGPRTVQQQRRVSERQNDAFEKHRRRSSVGLQQQDVEGLLGTPKASFGKTINSPKGGGGARASLMASGGARGSLMAMAASPKNAARKQSIVTANKRSSQGGDGKRGSSGPAKRSSSFSPKSKKSGGDKEEEQDNGSAVFSSDDCTSSSSDSDYSIHKVQIILG